MANLPTIKEGTIVQFGALLGVVIGQITNSFNVYNIDCGEQGVKTAKHGELTVINTNYVGTNMRISQFLPQVINRYEQVSARNKEFVKEYTAVLDATTINAYKNYVTIANAGTEKGNVYKALLATELNKTLGELKPSLRTESFYFGGLYYTDIQIIEVKEVLEDNGVIRPFLFLNGVKQTDMVFGQLCQIAEQEFAGRKVNDFTMKIGTSIGHTQTLRDVLAAYKAMQFTK